MNKNTYIIDDKYDFIKLKKYMDSLNTVGIPGCGCMITLAHEPIFKYYTGYSDYDGKKPASCEDIYWLYSSTKIATCVCIMRLLEEGLISLDDELWRYLPEFENMTIEEKGEIRKAEIKITIRQLLTMTAGFTYNYKSPELFKAAQNRSATTRELIAALAKDPLAFEPSTQFRYSLCHDVLGALIEVVSGMSFGEYIEKVITSPLGMKTTGFRLKEAQRKHLAAQYMYDMANYKCKPIGYENMSLLTEKCESGGSGLFSTVEDYAIFIDALANEGVGKNGYRVLKKASLEQMATNQLKNDTLLRQFAATPKKYGYGYGLGVRTHMRPEISLAKSPIGEFGWYGAAGSYAMIDMKNHLAVFFGMHVKDSKYTFEFVHPRLRDFTYEAIGL